MGNYNSYEVTLVVKCYNRDSELEGSWEETMILEALNDEEAEARAVESTREEYSASSTGYTHSVYARGVVTNPAVVPKGGNHMKGVYVLIDSSGADINDFIVGVYGSRQSAEQATREHLMGFYNIEEDEVDEHVIAVLNGEYDGVFCEYRMITD